MKKIINKKIKIELTKNNEDEELINNLSNKFDYFKYKAYNRKEY